MQLGVKKTSHLTEYHIGERSTMTMKPMVSQQQEIQHFIASFTLPQEAATSILRTTEDCQYFLNNFYGKNPRRLIDDLLDFLEDKIIRMNVSLETFLSRCSLGDGMLKVAFEETFLDDFSDETMEVISSALINHKITLEQLFLNFQQNPLKRIVSYVV